jgi:hypothetical protein
MLVSAALLAWASVRQRRLKRSKSHAVALWELTARVEGRSDPAQLRSLRVFEISRVGDGGEIGHVAVDLPAAEVGDNRHSVVADSIRWFC